MFNILELKNLNYYTSHTDLRYRAFIERYEEQKNEYERNIRFSGIQQICQNLQAKT